MKIAYVTMQFPAASETFAANDVRALRDAGAAVEVYTMRPPHADHDRLVRERGLAEIPLHTVDLPRLLRGAWLMLTRLPWTFTFLAWLIRWQVARPAQAARCVALAPVAFTIVEDVRRHKFDVVHLFWGHYPSIVGLLVQRYVSSSVASTFLGAYDLTEGRYGSWLPGSAPVTRQADSVWTHVDSNRKRLIDLGVDPLRLRVVHRGIDVSAFPRRAAGSAVAGKVVAVGRLIELKAMDDVVRAFARVRDVHAVATLTILGDGPDQSDLEALATELGVHSSISFRGHVNSSEVAAELRTAAAFVLLSRHDRIPNVVKEAMATGVPCVVTATPGMEELVEDGKSGYVVAIGDVEAAASKLCSILGDPRGHEAMANSARSVVEQRFDVDVAMATYFDVWSELVDARRATNNERPSLSTSAKRVDSAKRDASPEQNGHG